MGEISKLIGRIDGQLDKYNKTFKDEFYHPEKISPQMPDTKYKKIYSSMKKFDENYEKFVRLKKLNPKDKSETLKSIKKAMIEAGDEVLDFYSQFKEYSIYRDTLSKVGAQLKKFKEAVKKSDDPELSE